MRAWLACFVAALRVGERWHPWVYDRSARDAVGLPIRRQCPKCRRHQERHYNGYDFGAYGGWENVP